MEEGMLPRKIEFLSQIVVLFSLITFTLETDRELASHAIFRISEIIVVTLFTIEYLARVYVSKNKKRYMLSFYGLTDLLAILPAIITLGFVDLRFARIFRLLRLLRILKFVRYTRSINILQRAFRDIRGELMIFLFLTVVVVYISSVGIYYFEHKAQPDSFGSIGESLWWSIVTLTTVGYGDAYPITTGGRVFTTFILFIGLGIVAIPSGLLASSLQSARRKKAFPKGSPSNKEKVLK
ncbi:MAG: ion transporter [Pseudobacteriovorax sp.]|nr:ion transporter [Pseudobacteriovorax sp.]